MKANIPSLFQLYDKSIAKEPEWLDFDSQLHDFGAFANLFLPNLISLLKTKFENPKQFLDSCERCKSGLTALLEIIKDQEKNQHLTQHVIDLIENIQNSNLDETQNKEYFSELIEIIVTFFELFDMKMRRAQADLILLTTKQNKNKDVIQAQDQINKYISKTIAKMQSDIHVILKMSNADKNNEKQDESTDLLETDPLLLNVESAQKFISYLRSHRKPFPRCFCQEKATVFAVPCNCPCYCSMCWEVEVEAHQAKNCPRCGKPITELVEIA